MKKLSFFLAGALIIMTATAVQSCKTSSKASTSKMFKFNLEKGKGYDYELVWDLDTKAGGQTSAVSVTGLYSMNITDVVDNIRTITTSYKSMRMNMSVMDLELDIDSDKPEQKETDGQIGQVIGLMNKVVKGIIGKPFVMKVDDEGKVLEIKGFEKIFMDMVDSMGLDENMKAQLTASLKDQFSEQTMKDQFAQVFTIFPNKEIKVGDSWEKEYSTSGRMAAKYTTTYTAKEIEGDHVTLTAKTKITSSANGQEMDGTQTGSIIVDSKTGMMVNAEFDQNIEVKAQGQKVEVIGKGRIKGKAN
ncbi:MAG: DUF6263 family protein [Chitinophagaceae bacterium]